jgi:hypothetical protein
MKRWMAALALAALMTTGASAQRARERHENQSDRIKGGVQSGELTKAEAAKLRKKEAASRAKLRRDRVDGGGLTAKERLQTEKRQDRLSREIAKDKHDGQKR